MSSRSCRCRQRGGLTLVEIMCAVGIAAAVLVLLMGSLTSSIRAKRAASEAMRAGRLSAGFDQILRGDLRAVYAAGVGGGVGLIVRHGDVGAETSVLQFTTTNSLAPTSGGGVLHLVEYVLRPGDDSLEGLELVRRERPLVEGSEAGRAVEDLLAKGVAAWDLTCWDGTAWETEWHRRRLPRGIRLSYVFSGMGTGVRGQAVFAPVVSCEADPVPEVMKSETPAGAGQKGT